MAYAAGVAYRLMYPPYVAAVAAAVCKRRSVFGWSILFVFGVVRDKRRAFVWRLGFIGCVLSWGIRSLREGGVVGSV